MKSIGNVVHYEVKGGRLRMYANAAEMAVTVISPSCFRIQALLPHQQFKDTGYACPEPLHSIDFEIVKSEGNLSIATSVARLVISLAPFRVRLETINGDIINEDDPGLGIMWDGDEVTNYKTLQPGERFMGLGEKTGPLDKAGMQFRNWNTDAFAYTPSTDPLYVTCPFYMGQSHGRMYGVFLNNTSETVFNFGAANNRFSFFQAQQGPLDYFLFAGPEPVDILRDYSSITGRTPLPPLWSLGFQQCRYSYYPASEILRVAKTFRELNIPADVLYFDIHYMQDYKVFTWHKEHFPEPEAVLATLKEMGFHSVVILDPGVKLEAGYEVYEEGVNNEAFVKYPDGITYQGEAWPGWCAFPDFTDPSVRKWWAERVARFAKMGVDGFWNDMNEFAVWGKAIPKSLQFKLEGELGSLKEAHNIYGMQMSRATAEGAVQGLGYKRPFILTRATFAGGQRYSAVWTGDNYASNEHLLLGARMVSGMGLSGIPFVGNDIGGFTGEASAALYMRWMAQAVFHPLMRAHTMINSKSAEPWAYGEECTAVCRNYIGLRYQLLPHLYSLFYEASVWGLPPARSMVFRYHREWRIFAEAFQNQFFLGDHLLVCPVGESETVAKVYLPEGKWYGFFNDWVYEGGKEHFIELHRDTIPIFVQAGGILPMQQVIQHTGAPSDGVMKLHVYFGGEGEYTYYEDDGIGLDAQGLSRHMEVDLHGLQIDACMGDYISKYVDLRIYLHGLQSEEILLNGEKVPIFREDFRFMEVIPNFDPYELYPNNAKLVQGLGYIDVKWSSGVLGVKPLI